MVRNWGAGATTRGSCPMDVMVAWEPGSSYVTSTMVGGHIGDLAANGRCVVSRETRAVWRQVVRWPMLADLRAQMGSVSGGRRKQRESGAAGLDAAPTGGAPFAGPELVGTWQPGCSRWTASVVEVSSSPAS